MLNWVNEKTIEDEDKNYVIANLIRGGVFSKSKGNCPGTLRNNSLGIILLPEESRCDSLRL